VLDVVAPPLPPRLDVVAPPLPLELDDAELLLSFSSNSAVPVAHPIALAEPTAKPPRAAAKNAVRQMRHCPPLLPEEVMV